MDSLLRAHAQAAGIKGYHDLFRWELARYDRLSARANAILPQASKQASKHRFKGERFKWSKGRVPWSLI